MFSELQSIGACTQTHAHTHLYLHAHTCAHTCTDMRVHTQTHTHTHTHTHTVSLFRSPVNHLPFSFEIALRDVLSL